MKKYLFGMCKRLVIAGLAIMACLVISGCPPHVVLVSDMQSSKTKYKECLEAYPNDVSKCEGLKKLYEVDKDAVEAMGDQRPKGVILLHK